MNANAGWIAAGVMLFLFMRRTGGGGAAVAQAGGRVVTASDVAEAVPSNAGAMALSMWARSHAHDLGYEVPVGSGALDREKIMRGVGL